MREGLNVERRNEDEPGCRDQRAGIMNVLVHVLGTRVIFLYKKELAKHRVARHKGMSHLFSSQGPKLPQQQSFSVVKSQLNRKVFCKCSWHQPRLDCRDSICRKYKL